MSHETRDENGDARLTDLSSLNSRLSTSSISPLALTLRAWPVIALATIGLSFLTQGGAKLLGIELPDQQNIEIVRNCLGKAFSSAKAFGVAAFLVAQILVIMPAIEEVAFRWGLFKMVSKLVGKVVRQETRDASGDRKTLDARLWSVAVVSSALFSAAHYIVQPWPDSAFFALFFFGLAQCWLYRKTGRIWCAMTNHLLFNLTNLILLFVV